LVLTRHGESEWNKLNLFTGCVSLLALQAFPLKLSKKMEGPEADRSVSTSSRHPCNASAEKGQQEALTGAKALKSNGYDHFDIAFTSALTRAQQTLDIILKEIDQSDLHIERDQALNERCVLRWRKYR
jgi:2,3-bisphosphoglycerate-dependent phosphoglycerate mutase